MCGIVGYINRNGVVDKTTIKRMCSQIIHRGPDDEGLYTSRNIGVGVRRLSIIDPSGGRQPISNEDDSIRVVYNGEIYNYLELTDELTEDGHVFKTKSDTEVIIHLYEKYGTRCVEKLNGMFSLAIIDEKKNIVYIARDRLGIKPLYYYFDNNKLLFASEIKSLLVDEIIEQNISTSAIWDYLSFRYIPGPNTIWENIKKLEPAHWLQLSINTWDLEINRYWDIPYEVDSIKLDEKSDLEYLKEFTELLEDAVSRHLQADVPVGVLLSGGLDSSAVISAVNQLHKGKIYSFSVGFEDGGEFSELKYAREVASTIGAINHEVVIGHKEFVDFLNDFVWYSDEPLADLASVPLFYVSRLAASQVKVVLSGEGSDEILAGYDLEHIFAKYERFRKYRNYPSWFKSSFLRYLYNIRKNADYYTLPMNDNFHMTNIFTHNQKQQLFGSAASYPDSMNLVRSYYDRVNNVHPLNQIQYVLSQSWLTEDLLMKADKMTMANSIELRVPFLDHRLVEWAARLPVRLKIGDYNQELSTKKILRMYCQTKIPDSILNRPKQGFPVPAYKWLSHELKGFAHDIIGDNSYLYDYFDNDNLKSIVGAGTSNDAALIDRHRLWSLLILEIWMRRWLKK